MRKGDHEHWHRFALRALSGLGGQAHLRCRCGVATRGGGKERPTLFKTIIGTLNHNYLVDRIWQAHIEGRDHGFRARNLMLHARLPDLWEAQRAMNRWWIEWSAAQSSSSLDEPQRFRFVNGDDGVMMRGAILLHVVNHATYHRGWVADMFFQVPAPNPETDLAVFLGDAAARE